MNRSDLELRALTSLLIETSVNGRPWKGEIPVWETLLEFLRYRVGLTGTKRSCQSQVCGACTVLMDERPISSCSVLAFEIDGHSVTTVEGLSTGEKLDPVQEAFVVTGAVQCGYCTSGQLMAAKGLMSERREPTVEEIRRWMAGNICRCGCYPAILEALQRVSAGDTDGS